MQRSIVISALALFVFACGDDGTAAQGVYQISSWTENVTSCDSEGDSIAADQFNKFLYVANSAFFGQEFVSAATCSDLEECRTDVEEGTINLSGYAFEKGSDSDGWVGTGYAFSGQECSGEFYEDRLLVIGDSVTIERRATAMENVPRDSDDFCDGDAAEAMAKTLPCTRFESIKASLQEAL